MEKIIVTLTRGPENPEKAHIAFVVANAALETCHNAQVWLLSSSVVLCRIGQTEGLVYPPFEPIRHLIDEFICHGGKIYLFEPSLKSRVINEDELIKGIQTGTANELVQESIGATILNY